MSIHLFGSILTAKSVAANNRGENESTTSTLQKIIRNGEIFSTVSAEAIRYAIREVWLEIAGEKNVNRRVSHTTSDWKDPTFKGRGKDFLDDDVLGYMDAQKETISRRGILEITRAISTISWPGTISHNFASPGAQNGKNKDPIPYAVEIHDTRYQYSFAMTPENLAGEKKDERVKWTLEAVQNLHRVAGNHARFLFDFSPEVVVLRLTHDPAPRMLLCFDENEQGAISLKRLQARVEGKDIDAKEIFIGAPVNEIDGLKELKDAGADVKTGVKEAFNNVLQKICNQLRIK